MRGPVSPRRSIYDRLVRTVASASSGEVSIVDYGDVLSSHGVFHEYLDGVQVRTPDGIHTPAHAAGNVFAGTTSEGITHASYDWLSPRLRPLIVASDGRSARSGGAGAPLWTTWSGNPDDLRGISGI